MFPRNFCLDALIRNLFTQHSANTTAYLEQA